MISCPLCQNETKINLIDGEEVIQCPACGAFKDTNPISGNTVWMRNGRLVMAEEDIKDQQKKAKSRGFKKENLKGNELSHG